MAVIQVLPREVSELIAAGEVIERPASIIKELVENAIDAGSTAVTVEIQGGGIRYIRVTDNGCGMSREDAPRAFLRHATSKVGTAEDLDHIDTLGFRGEALASISAVAHLEVLTRPAGEDVGTRVKLSGSELEEVEDCGCPPGTTMVVRDIFYNVPARLKFLKRDVTEGNAVASIVDKIALSHPEISFQLIRDGKMLYRTPGDGELMGAVYTVLGREFARSMLPVDYELGNISVTGFICRPMGARAKRSMQHFFINGRYTQSRTCQAALERGYDGSMMTGKFPTCVLQLKMPSDQVDVNVHPAKIEVRFVDEKAVFDSVYFAVKSALSAEEQLTAPAVRHPVQEPLSSLTPPAPSAQMPKKAAPPSRPEKTPVSASVPSVPQTKVSEQEKPVFAAEPVPGARIQVKEEWLPPHRTEVKLDVEPDPEDFFDLLTIPSQVAAGGDSYRLSASPEPQKEKVAVPKEKEPEVPVPSAQKEAELPVIAAPEIALPEDPALLVPDQKPEIFGEIFSTYILARIGQELVIIDKHAAHERILYNQLHGKYEQLNRQLLMTSVQVPLSRAEHEAVLEQIPLLQKLGFEVEDFGGSTVVLRAVPAMMSEESPAALFQEVVAGIMEAGRHSVGALEEILHRMACRSAVKGGDVNRPEELVKLVETICADEQVRYCPHGRPVMIRYTRRELEKLFGRIQ